MMIRALITLICFVAGGFLGFFLYSCRVAYLIEQNLPAPALDFVLKCSHTFNLLEARGVISVTERTATIGRIRNLARKVAEAWLAEREAL